MRDVIQKIIATESEAKLTVESARTEASRILSDAQRKGRDIIAQARQEVIAEAEKIIEIAMDAAEKEKQFRLNDAIAKIENQIQLKPADKNWAVEEVIRCVCKQT